ncbi:MAG: SURF1-like protein [marine bacterium B5-7]|nr:MAG: SURF1-like protein [marine bacterium B5-7]
MKRFSIYFTLILILLSLSAWQLSRYHEKQALLQAFTHQQKQAAISLEQLNKQKNKSFTRLKVTGHYLNQYTILIENRRNHGRQGMWQVTPFLLQGSGACLLVNRGWLQRPDLTPVTGKQTLMGWAKTHQKKPFILGKNIYLPIRWPLNVQYLDMPALEKIIGHHLSPISLRLAPENPHGFIREWQIVNILPQRHLAYAIQWLLFALIALGIYLFNKRK